jgi:hypothetical protein
VPAEWLNASLIQPGVYDNLIFGLENEVRVSALRSSILSLSTLSPCSYRLQLDWPHLSSATGFFNSTESVPVDSTYLHLRDRNRCNHRDYQNIAVCLHDPSVNPYSVHKQ